jgi:hypothetical protein
VTFNVSASQHHGDVRQTIRAGERVERWLGFHAACGGPVDAETNIVYVAGGRQLMKGWDERGRRLGWATSHTGVFHLHSHVCCAGQYRAYYLSLSGSHLSGDFQRGFTSGPVMLGKMNSEAHSLEVRSLS